MLSISGVNHWQGLNCNTIIVYNCKKTIGVLFCPKNYKQPAPSNVFLNGVRVQFCGHVNTLVC